MDRYHTLKFVTYHLGALFPYFAKRVEKNVEGLLKDKIATLYSEYLKNIYGDTALDGAEAALPCGYAFFGPERMMFGTDYPCGSESGEDFVRSNLAGLKAMNIPEEHKKKILGENAKKFLKIK